jgi:hypothetical protein
MHTVLCLIHTISEAIHNQRVCSVQQLPVGLQCAVVPRSYALILTVIVVTVILTVIVVTVILTVIILTVIFTVIVVIS